MLRTAAAVVFLAPLAMTVTAASRAVAAGDPSVPCVVYQGVNDKCERWLTPYQASRSSGGDVLRSVQIDPKGKRVFVSGTTSEQGLPMSTTVAYNAERGTEAWVAHDTRNPPTASVASAISRDGRVLYVTGFENVTVDINQSPYTFPFTAAYSAASGNMLWRTLYTGIGQEQFPTAIAVSSNGDRVFVTGYQVVPNYQSNPTQYFTVAYAGRSGKELWDHSYFGVAGGGNRSVAIGVSPHGDRVFVSGFSQNPSKKITASIDYATLALSARNGKQLWVERYHEGAQNWVAALGVSPTGNRVYVTGAAQYAGSDTDPRYEWATVAYAAGTGRQQWVARHRGSTGGDNLPSAMAVGPGGVVVVTGSVERKEDSVPGVAALGAQTVMEADTTAYSSGGKQEWDSHFAPTGFGAVGRTVAVGGRSSRVYVGATVALSADAPGGPAIVSYSLASGRQQWTARYDVRHTPDGNDRSRVVGVVVAKEGRSVFEAFSSEPFAVTVPPVSNQADGLLLAYKA